MNPHREAPEGATLPPPPYKREPAGKRHIDALMEEWANGTVADADLLELLVSALAEFNSYQRNQERT